MKRELALPLAVLGICWLGLAAFVAATYAQLPARVATHFDGRGIPNGWMSRTTHAWAMIALGVGTSAFMLLIFAIVRRSGGWGFNLPHRDFWFAPERREATTDFIMKWGAWFACLFVAFDAGLHWIILKANAHSPVVLSNIHMGWLTATFLTALVVWVGALLRRFLRKT